MGLCSQFIGLRESDDWGADESRQKMVIVTSHFMMHRILANVWLWTGAILEVVRVPIGPEHCELVFAEIIFLCFAELCFFGSSKTIWHPYFCADMGERTPGWNCSDGVESVDDAYVDNFIVAHCSFVERLGPVSMAYARAGLGLQLVDKRSASVKYFVGLGHQLTCYDCCHASSQRMSRHLNLATSAKTSRCH